MNYLLYYIALFALAFSLYGIMAQFSLVHLYRCCVDSTLVLRQQGNRTRVSSTLPDSLHF